MMRNIDSPAISANGRRKEFKRSRISLNPKNGFEILKNYHPRFAGLIKAPPPFEIKKERKSSFLIKKIQRKMNRKSCEKERKS